MSSIKPDLIAPCGMNCGICHAYLREKNTCAGCNVYDENKRVSCQNCRIKNCENIKNSKAKFCYDCADFPCKRLKQLDKRYKEKYHMSMIENLEFIKHNGVEAFCLKEEKRWTCKNCGSIICVHKTNCLNCGNTWFVE